MLRLRVFQILSGYDDGNDSDLLRMARALFPKMIWIDMDPSAHLVYGQQQLGLINTHVGDTWMMPFYIFDGINGRIMTASLADWLVFSTKEASFKRPTGVERSYSMEPLICNQ